MEPTFGERELDVMSVLWRTGPGTVAGVRERLPVTLAYNTVLTILRNLEAKGLVGHTVEGRTFRYHPAVTEQTVQGGAVAKLVEKLFSGSALRMVAHLVDGEALSEDELRRLHQMLDSRLAADATRHSRARTGRSSTPQTRRHR